MTKGVAGMTKGVRIKIELVALKKFCVGPKRGRV